MSAPAHTRFLASAATALVAACLMATPAAAQTAPASTGAVRPKTLTVALGGLASYGGGGVDLRVSAAIPITERRTLELFAGLSESGDYLNTQGVYGVQFRRPRGKADGDHQFYTSIGLMGLVARYETFDCIHVTCGWTTTNHLLPPMFFLAGGGADFAVKPRLRMHVESQLAFALFVPVSVRVAIGVSVPLGRARSASRKPF